MDDTFGDMTPTLRDGVEDDYPAEEEYDYGYTDSTTMEGDDGFNMPVSGEADGQGNLLSSQNNLNVEENDNLAFGKPRIDPASGNIDDPNADVSFDRNSTRFTLNGNLAKWRVKHRPVKISQNGTQLCGTKMSFTSYFQSLLHRAYAATFSPFSGSSSSSSSSGKNTNTSGTSGSDDTITTVACSTASSTSFSPRKSVIQKLNCARSQRRTGQSGQASRGGNVEAFRGKENGIMTKFESTPSSSSPVPPLSPALEDMISPRVFNTTGQGVGEGRRDGDKVEEEKRRTFNGPVWQTTLTIMQVREAEEEGEDGIEEEWRLAGMPKKEDNFHEDEQDVRHPGDDDGGKYDIPLPLAVDTQTGIDLDDAMVTRVEATAASKAAAAAATSTETAAEEGRGKESDAISSSSSSNATTTTTTTTTTSHEISSAAASTIAAITTIAFCASFATTCTGKIPQISPTYITTPPAVMASSARCA
ncbi:hypothetical protein VYU27_004365 [Nannochloropsis oceanica]